MGTTTLLWILAGLVAAGGLYYVTSRPAPSPGPTGGSTTSTIGSNGTGVAGDPRGSSFFNTSTTTLGGLLGSSYAGGGSGGGQAGGGSGGIGGGTTSQY